MAQSNHNTQQTENFPGQEAMLAALAGDDHNAIAMALEYFDGKLLRLHPKASQDNSPTLTPFKAFDDMTMELALLENQLKAIDEKFDSEAILEEPAGQISDLITIAQRILESSQLKAKTLWEVIKAGRETKSSEVNSQKAYSTLHDAASALACIKQLTNTLVEEIGGADTGELERDDLMHKILNIEHLASQSGCLIDLCRESHRSATYMNKPEDWLLPPSARD